MRFDQIYRVVGYQLMLALAAGFGWVLLAGSEVLGAVVLGGLTAVVPTGLQGALIASQRNRAGAHWALSVFYLGSVLKLLLTGVMFVVAIAIIKVEFVPLISVYIVALAGYWMALVRVTPQRRGRVIVDGNRG